MGTNSRIFELQTERGLCYHGQRNRLNSVMPAAAIRQGLGDGHSYEWLDGSIKTEMAPGMQDLVAPDDEFLMYVDDTAETRRQVLTDMDNFLAMETEPFDGLLAFSLGAGCSASYLIHKMQQGTPTNRLPFRFAVFFCGAPALFGRPIRETVAAPSMDAEIIGIDKAREGDSGKPSEVIEIPTAHIWGRNDTLWGYGPELSRWCKSENREIVVHDGGHEIPGPRDPVTLARCLQAIKRTIARAGGDE
ncbi:hypothetical protein AnigIFM63326_011319 [Aspergillus niger]|nr:hypothetical protein AnigIFM63326_011319 [Aspergillus niger]